jgi:hypothetical protein
MAKRFAVIGCPGKGAQMIDQWDEKLRCPQCHNTGMTSLSQFKDANMPTVDRVSDGFKVVQTEYGPNFHCGTCNVRAIP